MKTKNKMSKGFTPTPTLSLPRFFNAASMSTQTKTDKTISEGCSGETKKPRQSWCRGFTMIEMVIYIAFLAILSVVAIQGVVISLKALYAMRINQSINGSATTALERMSREIHNAISVDTANSTLGSHPGRLTLNTKDSGGANTTVEFYVSGGQISLKEGGVDKGSLVSRYATTTNLVFRRSTTTNSMAVRVELSLSDTRASSTVVKFYDTMVLRGSAH